MTVESANPFEKTAADWYEGEFFDANPDRKREVIKRVADLLRRTKQESQVEITVYQTADDIRNHGGKKRLRTDAEVAEALGRKA